MLSLSLFWSNFSSSQKYYESFILKDGFVNDWGCTISRMFYEDGQNWNNPENKENNC